MINLCYHYEHGFFIQCLKGSLPQFVGISGKALKVR